MKISIKIRLIRAAIDKAFRAFLDETRTSFKDSFLLGKTRTSKRPVKEAKEYKEVEKSVEKYINKLGDELKEDVSADKPLVKVFVTLGNKFKRTLNTELGKSYNAGKLEGIKEGSKDPIVYAIGPVDDATCKFCLKFYHEGNSFKLYRLSQLEASGNNIGRKTKDWAPTIPPLHPHCRHHLVELPKGWALDKDGRQYFVSPKFDSLKKSLQGKTPTFTGWKLQDKYRFQGMDISIENKKGSFRKWKNKNGKEGRTLMQYDYGYIRNTLSGADGDHIDCYIGPNEDAKNAYIVHQNRPDTGEFDEDKVMLGFDSAKEAKEAYLKHYDNEKFFGSMTTLEIESFKEKVIGKEVAFIKSIELIKGAGRQSHKYIKRTGSPGNYRYWYRDPKTGEIYAGDKAGDKGKNEVSLNPGERKSPKKVKIKHLNPKQFQPATKGSKGSHILPTKNQLKHTLKNGSYSIISAGRNMSNTADANLSDEEVVQRYDQLESDLKGMGLRYSRVIGSYGAPEDSFIVYNAQPDVINALGKRHNQESVIHSKNSQHQLFYVTGQNAGKFHNGDGFEEKPNAKDFYTEVNHPDGDKTKFALNFDFDTLHQAQDNNPENNPPLGSKNWEEHSPKKGDFYQDDRHTISYEKLPNGKYNVLHNNKPISIIPFNTHEQAVHGYSGYLDRLMKKQPHQFKKIKKSSVQRGGQRPNHKYIKRTGGPGNYRYWYKDDKGRLFSSDTPVNTPKGDIKGKVVAKKRAGVLTVVKNDGSKPVKYVKAAVPKPKITVKTKTKTPEMKLSPHNLVSPEKIKKYWGNNSSKIPQGHAVHFIKQDNNIVGHIITAPDEFLNDSKFPTVVDVKVRGADKVENLVKVHEAFMRQNPLLSSPPVDGMKKDVRAAWIELERKYPEKVKFDSHLGKFVYDNKEESLKEAPLKFSEYQPEQPQSYQSDFVSSNNPEFVYGEFTKNGKSFNKINEGICGKKGLVNLTKDGSKKVFVKSEVGGAAKVNDGTKHELTYTEVVHTTIPELSEHFPVKYRLSDDTFMQEYVHMESNDHDNYQQNMAKFGEKNSDRLVHLSVLNYLLGNKDRHSYNQHISGNGKFTLFDEGLTFRIGDNTDPNAEFSSKRPSYDKFIQPNHALNKESIQKLFSEDRRDKITQILRKNGISENQVVAFNERWDTMYHHLNTDTDSYDFLTNLHDDRLKKEIAEQKTDENN